MKKSRRFYVDLLGFSVIRENYRPERDDYKIDLQLDGMELELLSLKIARNAPVIQRLTASGILPLL